jgi:midasin
MPQVDNKVLHTILRLWWESYWLVSQPNFEDAVFQAHLVVSTASLVEFSTTLRSSEEDSRKTQDSNLVLVASQSLVQLVYSEFKRCFDSGFKLTTGLSMELLWNSFRPKQVSSFETLQTLVKMEHLAERFDDLKWKTSISIQDVARVMSSLVEAYRLILDSEVDGGSLIQALSSELASLEESKSTDAGVTAPFFSNQFEAIRQFEILQNAQGIKEDILALATNSTASLMQFAGASSTFHHLHSIGYLWGQGHALFPIQDSFSASLLHKLENIDDVELRSLSLLEAELPILGQHVAQGGALLCRNQVLDMNENLVGLLMKTMEAHGPYVLEQVAQWDEQLDSVSVGFDYAKGLHEVNGLTGTLPSHLQVILQDYMKPSFTAIMAARSYPENQMEHSSLAWILFAVGCIALYVPDRPFDPNNKQKLERQRYERMKQSLEDKIGAFRAYENMFTSQDTNIRCQLLTEQLEMLEEPQAATNKVLRPEISELDQLQGEFSNLLKTVLWARPQEVVRKHFESGSEDTAQEIKLLQNNLVQIIRRLSERFRAYADMTVPVVGMLRCLQVGLCMATQATKSASSSGSMISTLAGLTPFLGGETHRNENTKLDSPLDSLPHFVVLASIEDITTFEADRRRSILDIFHESYVHWSKRLDIDRKEAEAKTGLYRFRGSAEDEEEDDEEEFNELFPSYDDEASQTPKSSRTAPPTRDTAIALAKMHARIFMGGSTPTECITTLMREVSQRIGSVYTDQTTLPGGEMTRTLLPGALLRLNDQIEALNSTSTTADIPNFYTDPNLLEVRQLVTLTHDIMKRFKQLQNVDEIGHMQPLEDVIVSCNDLVRFSHTEPLAKIITKVEKIHTYMHEWQFGGWASRANSVLALYDSLTSTIVRWRRLELSTWAKLFDMENRKCDDDAKSWWFIAYEVVIAAPISMAQSETELRNYVQKLLKDLETYFATAICGQFVRRLQLLKQLQQHLRFLVLEIPLMSIVLTALSNFTEIYSRYEKPVTESLNKGRQVLEKAMRDVLLLASWKDTNIVALRDSAKRSHHKLFKLVRKYRALLGQPMEQILQQGLPDEPEAQISVIHTPSRMLPSLDKTALAVCESQVPSWAKKSKRLINVSKTVGLMDDTSQIPPSAMDGFQYLESFVANILTSTTELQKETPSLLTEDNKDTVTHLKTRKRKLFAETLRELRQMGVKHNLGTVDLSQQESLSMILSNTENLHPSSSTDLNYYYHKTLDCVPRAREATRNHSEDLTKAEISRSAGLLEGLLQIVLKQRNKLAVAMAETDKLATTMKVAQALWSPGKYDIKKSSVNLNHFQALKWLPHILRVGSELVRIHGKLGKIERHDIQDMLALHNKNLTSSAQDWTSLPVLPPGIISTAQKELEIETTQSIQRLCSDLDNMTRKYPDLEFILKQIIPWTNITSSEVSNSTDNHDISSLDRKLSNVCDAMLVAVEKLTASLAKLPTSAEDQAWLVQNDSCLADNIASLHIGELTGRISQTFEILQGINLDHGDNSRIAGALFAVALPIFQQYSNIVQQSIWRFSQFHRATCKMTYVLAKTFTQIASQGFCTPSEKSDAKDGKAEKLEGGTGLGDGDGAEDISKDVQDDEDLSELAQQPNKEEKGEMEDEQDAVDMADGDMEGEMGDAEEKAEEGNEDGKEDEDGDEMDEEAGDVDDLDPNAVDEKMWDGEGEKAEKDQEGDQSKGKADKDEQAAAQESDMKAPEGDEGDEGDEEEELGAEQGEEVKQEEAEKHDPHAQDGEALELPDDIELDGNDQDDNVSGSDDGMDGLSDVNDDSNEKDNEMDDSNEIDADGEDVDAQENQEVESDLDVIDLDEGENENGEKTEEAGEKGEEEPQPEVEDQQLLQDRSDDAMADPDNDVPSEVQGTGEDQENDQSKDNETSMSKAERDDGGKSGESAEQKEKSTEEGENGRQTSGAAPTNQDDETQDSAEAQPFKKLGDALERWHKQQTKIRDAPEEKDKGQEQPMEVDGDETEFQHLQDEDAQPDAQAMGTATEDQAHAVDESMAIDNESKDLPETFQPEEAEPEEPAIEDAMDVEMVEENEEKEQSDAYEGRAGAMIQQANKEREREPGVQHTQHAPDVEEEIEEVDVQLSTTHIDDLNTLFNSRSNSEARQLWTHYESLTHDLSLSLTEQLRLILAPTLATKMRGDFRTGKRLNIKRIIPYIASQYKRDKIWMRRSVPSKRSYQIMLALDDSKSMGQSGSGSLAFETLVMVSKSLSMLEVGEICVVGFGENVRVAHDFETPFSAEAGPKIFQNFGFDQNRTDVTKLVRESIEHFRTARAKASSSPADLWQLELIISDGVCDSSAHDDIRRLLREAIEERIMIVFIIVDDVKSKKSGESVMDLKEAKFMKDEATGATNVKIERYLDTFPFQYYLIVSDVKELPGVLATLLRQWFAEVADSS